jgi:hypothetical protein
LSFSSCFGGLGSLLTLNESSTLDLKVFLLSESALLSVENFFTEAEVILMDTLVLSLDYAFLDFFSLLFDSQELLIVFVLLNVHFLDVPEVFAVIFEEV